MLKKGRRQYAEAVKNGGCASDCIACGQCERACPPADQGDYKAERLCSAV